MHREFISITNQPHSRLAYPNIITNHQRSQSSPSYLHTHTHTHVIPDKQWLHLTTTTTTTARRQYNSPAAQQTLHRLIIIPHRASYILSDALCSLVGSKDGKTRKSLGARRPRWRPAEGVKEARARELLCGRECVVLARSRPIISAAASRRPFSPSLGTSPRV